jgi:hypothetical protein
MHDLTSNTVWADALFASTLQSCDEPSAAQVRRAASEAVRTFGVRGCLARVAQAFGEDGESAVRRMRWARSAVNGAGDVGGAFGTACPEACPEPARALAA